MNSKIKSVYHSFYKLRTDVNSSTIVKLIVIDCHIRLIKKLKNQHTISTDQTPRPFVPIIPDSHHTLHIHIARLGRSLRMHYVWLTQLSIYRCHRFVSRVMVISRWSVYYYCFGGFTYLSVKF